MQGGTYMTELTYIKHGDYYYPNLTVGDQPTTPLGKYGRMRRTYLMEHRQLLLNQLVLSGKLFWHLTEIDQAAQHRLDTMMPQLMKQRGITEELKSRDPMRWVAEMNAAKAQVEEIIFTELVYA